MTKDGDVEPFYVCDFFTLFTSVLVDLSKGSTKFYVCVKFTLKLARFRGWLSGMEMDSYKSQISDGVLMGSGTKTKSYEPVSQIACVRVSMFWY